MLHELCALPYRTMQEIALDMGVTYRTLRTHVGNLLNKIGVPDARALVVTELTRRAEAHSITKIERKGTHRLAIVTVQEIVPVDVHEAIVALNLGGTIYVLSADVQTILDGMQVER